MAPPSTGQQGSQQAKQADKPAVANAPKPDATRHKVKRGGKEAEYSAEDLARMASDDYEHEIPGTDKTIAKVKWPDMVRGYQQHSGAMTRLREAAEMKATHAQELDWARNNIPAYIESRLIDPQAKDGPKSFDDIAMSHVAQIYRRDEELKQLIEPTVVGQDGQLYHNPKYNPTEYNRRQAEVVRTQLERQRSIDEHFRTTAEQQRQHQETEERRHREVGEAIQATGLKPSKHVMALAAEVYAEYRNVEQPLSDADLAAFTKQKYISEHVDGYVNSLDDDGWLAWMGDERAKRFQEILVARAKGVKREERAAAKEEKQHEAPAQRNGKGLTEAELRKKYG